MMEEHSPEGTPSSRSKATSGDGFASLASLRGALGWEGIRVDLLEFPGKSHNDIFTSRGLHASVLNEVAAPPDLSLSIEIAGLTGPANPSLRSCLTAREDGKPARVYCVVQFREESFCTNIVLADSLLAGDPTTGPSFDRGTFVFGCSKNRLPSKEEPILITVWDGGWNGQEATPPAFNAADFAGFVELTNEFDMFTHPKGPKLFPLLNASFYQNRVKANKLLGEMQGPRPAREIQGGQLQLKVRSTQQLSFPQKHSAAVITRGPSG